jgi:hypothetical protein
MNCNHSVCLICITTCSLVDMEKNDITIPPCEVSKCIEISLNWKKVNLSQLSFRRKFQFRAVWELTLQMTGSNDRVLWEDIVCCLWILILLINPLVSEPKNIPST